MLGEYDKAIADFTRAMRWEFSPRVAALVGRAKAYRAIGDEAKALKDEQEARGLREADRNEKKE